MSDADEEKKVQKNQELPLVPGKEFHSIIFTGKPVDIQLVGFQPMIDCHMHIQSNNCAPLPLQWGLVGHLIEGERRTMNNLASSGFIRFIKTKDLGRIGRLSTESIAGIVMQDMKNTQVKNDMYWTFVSKDDLKKYEALRNDTEKKMSKDEEDKIRKEVDDRVKKEADISDIITKRNNQYGNFHTNTAYYFGKKYVYNMFVMLPMDLSYAHFWGQFGLPICIAEYNEKGKVKDYYYINDILWFSKILDDNGDRINYSINHYYDRIYLKYDIDLVKNKFYFNIKSLSKDKKNELLNEYNKKTYKHFVDVIKGENEETFEDYDKQMKKTKNSSVMYPFQLIPFYNYDPRRHNPGRMSKDKLLQDHIFFEYNKKTENYSSQFLTSDYEIKIKDFDFDKIFENNKRKNDDVFNEVNSKSCSNGPYFGFKMYTRLGFAPWDFDAYPEMKEFFQQCVSHDLPVTCHTSFGGMEIADMDTYLYEARIRAEKGKSNKRENEIMNESDSKVKFDFTKSQDSTRYVNEMFVNPKNWKKVFDTEGLSNLRFNFAHFGSWELWSEHWFTDEYHDWHEKVAELLKDSKYPNIYADMAYFNNFWPWHVDAAARNIAKHCENEKFRKHVLFGSDWYMFEMEGTFFEDGGLLGGAGIGIFYNRMFNMLKKVSDYANPKFDAWYQFTVVNPLRFLGLIADDGDDTDKTISAAGKQRLENHLNYINKMLDDTKFQQDSGITDKKEIGAKKAKAEELKNIIIDYTKLLDTKNLNEFDDKGNDKKTLLILKKPEDKNKK